MTYTYIVEWYEVDEGVIWVDSRCPRCGQIGGDNVTVKGSVEETLASLDKWGVEHLCDSCHAYIEEQEERLRLGLALLA